MAAMASSLHKSLQPHVMSNMKQLSLNQAPSNYPPAFRITGLLSNAQNETLKRLSCQARVEFGAASVFQSLGDLRKKTDSLICKASISGRQEKETGKGGPEDGPATPFHLAFPVNDLDATREFYGRILGCPEGRSAETWIDYNLFGHQIVCHLIPGYNGASTANPVDGDPVPVPHFGLAMSQPDFHSLAARVREAGIEFVIEPHLRFKGAPGEQWTMFFRDPSGNSLEFKAMTNPENLFAKYRVEN